MRKHISRENKGLGEIIQFNQGEDTSSSSSPDTDTLTVEKVLEHATEASLTKIIIIGTTKDKKFYLSSTEEQPDINFLLDIGKRYLLPF